MSPSYYNYTLADSRSFLFLFSETEYTATTIPTTAPDMYTVSLVIVFVVAVVMVLPIINQCYEDYRRLFVRGYDYVTVPVINQNGDTHVSLLAKDEDESDELE